MKVLFLGPASSIHTQRWVRALVDRGIQVYLISLPEDIWEKPIATDNLRIVYLKISGKKGYYLNGLELSGICKKICPDVVNVHYASGYGTLARIAKLPNEILSVWGSDVYEFPYQSKLKGIIIRKNINHAKYLASTSHCMAKQVDRVMGREMKCTITPFGVDPELFQSNHQEKTSDKFVFGIVKTLSPKYGINYLIEAYAEFVKAIPEAQESTELRIYGDGPDRDKLEKQSSDTGLQSIYFYGKIPNQDVPKVLNNFDVFCCSSSSSSESFGVAAVEAMACELPVIATDVDGFKEVVDDGITGLIIPRKNPQAMAEKMKYLFENPDICKSMGMAGRKRVLSKYCWDDNVSTMIHLYEKAVATK